MMGGESLCGCLGEIHGGECEKHRRADDRISQILNERGEAYTDRNLLAVAFAKACRALGMRVWLGTDANELEWPVLYIQTPQGQVSWHIPKEVADHSGLSYEPPYGETRWDGHGTEQKRGRLNAFNPSSLRMVYIQSVGQYSDQRILGVFSTRDKALALKQKYDTTDTDSTDPDSVGGRHFCSSWGGKSVCVDRIRESGHTCDSGTCRGDPSHGGLCPGHSDSNDPDEYEVDGFPGGMLP